MSGQALINVSDVGLNNYNTLPFILVKSIKETINKLQYNIVDLAKWAKESYQIDINTNNPPKIDEINAMINKVAWVNNLIGLNKLRQKAVWRGINILGSDPNKRRATETIKKELISKKWYDSLTGPEKIIEYENYLKFYQTNPENNSRACKLLSEEVRVPVVDLNKEYFFKGLSVLAKEAGIDIKNLTEDEIRTSLAHKMYDSPRSYVQWLASGFTSKKGINGTSRGSQARALIKGTIGALTGLGNTAPVLWDFKRQKFRVSVNPGPGYENFEIIGSNAVELASDYRVKSELKKTVGRSTLGSVTNGVKSVFSGITGFFTKSNKVAPAGGRRKTMKKR